jgi:hypothetical protein
MIQGQFAMNFIALLVICHQKSIEKEAADDAGGL